MSTTPEPEAEVKFVPFKDLNAVPAELMQHQGARLSLEMVNHLCDRAYALGTSISPNIGAAWVEFRDSHHIENEIWVGN